MEALPEPLPHSTLHGAVHSCREELASDHNTSWWDVKHQPQLL